MNDIPLPRNPLVSVIIPVYNGEKYVQECLESVYQQTYRPIEVIIVDDGSTDNSLQAVKKVPGEKKIIAQQNRDVSHARNTGVSNAAGEFIAFLDQDDIWHHEKLEKQVQVFQAELEVDLIFTDLIKFNEEGKMRHPKDRHRYASKLNDENLFAMLVRKNVLMPSAVMVKKEGFVKAGMFDPQFKTCGDYEMWLRMASKNMKFRYVAEPLTMYRYHSKNVSKQTLTMHNDRIKVMEKIFSSSYLSLQEKALRNLGLASVYMQGAHSFFSINQYTDFIENAKKAVAFSRHVITLKFITRYFRSWLHLKFGMK